MLWSEKLPFAGYSVVKEQMGSSTPNPTQPLRRDPDAPLRDRKARMCASAPHGKPANFQRLAPKLPAVAEAMANRLRWQARAGLPAVAHRSFTGKRRLVENTGLEPVTSWLQTRRSPS